MKDEEQLINANIQIDQNKEEINNIKGLKLNLFIALYGIDKFHGLYKLWDFIFTIFEFIQLMAFPMDKIFNKSWGNYWVNSFGNFFRFFQLIFLWRETAFFVSSYIITCLFIIIILSIFFHILFYPTSLRSQNLIKLIVLILQMMTALNLPFLRTLFSIFSCDNDKLEVSSEIKCKSGVHIFLIAMSIILIIILKCFMILFHTTLYEFGVNKYKLKSGYSSSTEVLLDFTRLILVIVYQFISHEVSLAIITLLLSIIILFHFLAIRPFSNSFTIKLYLILYLLFCWSSAICIISIFLRNSKFQSGVILLILGYPIIVIMIVIKEDWDFSIDKLLKKAFRKLQGAYQYLVDIEYFLKLEDNLTKKQRTGQHKLLYSYISGYETNCTDENCYLKKFMKLALREENYSEMEILLLQHGELLYKNAISKYPYDIKLRLRYILFLFNRMNKKSRGKSEIFLLNKFETNLETSFLIYKVQRYIEENMNDKEENKEIEKNNNFSQTTSYKLMINEVKSTIENILVNYVEFWNLLMSHEGNKNENFSKMSKIGEEVRALNRELNEKINSLEAWNIIDQETFKMYVKYLKEILNNNEEANIYSSHISENHHKHQYDEINLYELNYKELSTNEDYKYIIVDCSKFEFNKICNISFQVCKLFGYTKEELIGSQLDLLFPDIYKNYRKKLFEEKVNIYKQKLLIQKKKINSDTWIDENFGRNKIKYLIPFKAKWTLITSDEEKIYAIGNIILENKKIINANEQDIVYVLTDRNLIIQNFTSNATRILNLSLSITHNNCNISNYITELNDNYLNEIEPKNDREESNIGSLNNTNVKRKTRFLKSEILKKYNYLGKTTINTIHWKLGEINNLNNNNNKKSIIYPKFQNFFDDSINNSNFNYGKRTSISNYLTNEKIEMQNHSQKIKTIDPIKQMNLSELNSADINPSKFSNEINTNERNNNGLKQKEKKFNLKVNEAKFNDEKVGYIFIFLPYNKKTEQLSINNSTKNELIKSKENGETDISDESIMSFYNDKKTLNYANTTQIITTPFNISTENSDEFFNNFVSEKDEQFTFNMKDMSYKLFKYDSPKKNFYDDCKDEAVKRVTFFKKEIQEEESEEEEESYESDYTSEEGNPTESELSDKKEVQDISKNELKKNNNEEEKENSVKSSIGSKEGKAAQNSAKKSLKQNTIQNPLKTTTDVSKKKEEEEFYHVNTTKISYLVFNFTSGYVETIKGQNHKISQVTSVMNAEKEKLKSSNSRYVANAKYIKGKKKGIINKKEENEINPFSFTSLKLKEIYKALSSKEKESSIIKLFVVSLIIFAFVIGTGVLNILMFYYLKDDTYTFYVLIQKSCNLYQNLLFEITFVREMLILNNSYYTNPLHPNKELYYRQLTKTLYNYYTQNAAIISSLTNNFNILSENDEQSITNIKVDLHIIDPLQSGHSDLYYQYKSYKVLVYSAYRELNAALYHISLLEINEIYQYNDDVYYFMKNGMSELLMASERQIFNLKDKFNDKLKTGQNLLIICISVVFVIYLICTFVFVFFNKKVKMKKEKYLSLFNELDDSLITLSLVKCEKFTQKLQKNKENKNIKNLKNSIDSSTINYSEMENDNPAFMHDKKNKDDKVSSYKKEKTEKNKKCHYYNMFHFILFLLLFVWQIAIYIYYYEKLNLFKYIITYQYYISMFASNFLFAFISLREYIFDKKTIFNKKTIEDYVNNTLANYYVIYLESAKMKDLYRVHFPDSYQDFLNHLYSGKICEFINIFIQQYPDNGINQCNKFFYGTPDYGFFTLLTTFIEEIRSLRVKLDHYYDNATKYGFTYNETFLNDPNGYYDKYYEQYKDNIDLYKEYNPANILGTKSHRDLLIIYLFINTQVYNSLISESLNYFEKLFSDANSINLIINIIFFVVVVLGFVFIWIPLLFKENETIFKIKNMLSIIPSEMLINLPDINVLLGIDESKI